MLLDLPRQKNSDQIRRVGSSASVSEPSIRSAGRPRAAVPTWFVAMRTFVLLFAPLPLAIRLALPDAALFGYFFQRGFFIRLLPGHDFAHALGYAHSGGLRSQ